jgi:putative DNA primase/helicase
MREFDKNPYVFNCQNGTLNLSSGAFAPHSPDDLLTKMSGVRYDPDARCERWETFIDEVMSGDRDKARFLQKALGYALTGDTALECMFILFGPTTRNGKGTCMETYLEMMGDYGVSTRPETIGIRTGNNGSTPTEDIARLAGARFANVSEPDRKLVLNASLVKSMVGNDTLNARNLYENSFDFKPQFKLFVNCNHLPTVTDTTVFSSGRIKIIPFDRHFEEHEQDLSLKAFLRNPENLSGVFNWCVEGCRLMRETGLEMPQSVKDATAQYAHVSDKTKLFIEDVLDIDMKYETPTAEVYAKYRDWCQENGYFPESARNLNAALQEDARLKVERKRPERGGDKTTVLLGARLNGDISLF